MSVFDYSLIAQVFAMINLVRESKYLWFTSSIFIVVTADTFVTLFSVGSSGELLDNGYFNLGETSSSFCIGSIRRTFLSASFYLLSYKTWD